VLEIGGRAAQQREQAPDLICRYRDWLVADRAVVRFGAGEVGSGGGQERHGQHGQGDVPVPGGVEPDLIVVQSNFVLGGLEAFLDRPAGPGHPDQIRQDDGSGGVTQVERKLVRFGDRAADQQRVGRAGGGEKRPVIPPVAFGAIPATSALPSQRGMVPARVSARRRPTPVAT
jgi:hypothetical protein